MTGVIALLVTVFVTGAVAVVMRWKNGRFSRGGVETNADATSEVLGADDIGGVLGERATLVQFSSAFCAPCRATRRILTETADIVPGVVTHEIDAESHLDLVRRLDVLRTPTVFVLDASGAIVSRASGAPTRDQVIAALDRAIPEFS